jgi:very-short-patch-repair endonuclease
MAFPGRSADQPYFFGASPLVKSRAKKLRQRTTFCEKILWQELRKKRKYYLFFRRQHPISRFIVDFYCHEIRLVIEVDGGYHARAEQRERDRNRTADLENFGLKVIRFKNDEVIGNIRKVSSELDEVIRELTRCQPLPPRGAGV